MDGSIFCVFCGIGVVGKKFFLTTSMFPRGPLATGEANEYDLPLKGEIAGPENEDKLLFVGPTFDDDVSASDKYHGFRESRWCETVNENLEEEHEPSFAEDEIDEGSNRRDAARGYEDMSLYSSDSSKSSEDTIVVNDESSTNGFIP